MLQELAASITSRKIPTTFIFLVLVGFGIRFFAAEAIKG